MLADLSQEQWNGSLEQSHAVIGGVKGEQEQELRCSHGDTGTNGRRTGACPEPVLYS
jgi:hypothetical protein